MLGLGLSNFELDKLALLATREIAETPDLDLGGPATVYARQGEAQGLNIRTRNAPGPFAITLPAGCPPIATRELVPVYTPVNETFDITNPGDSDEPHVPPFYSHGDGITGAISMDYWTSGDEGTPVTWDDDAHTVLLQQGKGFGTGSLGVVFPDNADPLLASVPPRFRIDYEGFIANGSSGLMVEVGTYGVGGLNMFAYFEGGLKGTISGAAGGWEARSTASDLPADGIHIYSMEWIDDAEGAGGTVRYYIDDVQFGTDIAIPGKLKLAASALMTINNSIANFTSSLPNLLFKSVKLDWDNYSSSYVYEPITSGSISKTDLERLVLDATGLDADVSAKTISFMSDGGPASELTVIVGSPEYAAGVAYKAVLEDWSTGSAVPHPNELVLTRFSQQNCRFEDNVYGREQAPWAECVAEGPCPIIGDIAYRAEAIRVGDYVQIQFGYGWDTAVRPGAPFGDPVGTETYMVSHKWAIYDSEGTLIERIEKPNGSAMNASDEPNVFEGPWAYGAAMIGPDAPWYPSGTVRSSLIWRSAYPEDHDRGIVTTTLPQQVNNVPYALHHHYSNNGLDIRIYGGNSGGDGQINGYSNWMVTPWEKTDYDDMIALAGVTDDPYTGTGLYGAYMMGVASMSWLKYTPFNVMGRSPMTGPGGGRDDRQILPEPVAQYVSVPAGGRIGDGKSLRDIAIDYMTGYASDAVHGMENGRFGPLFTTPYRPITMRNHYYGPGEGSTPADQAWYTNGGRLYEIEIGLNPLRVDEYRGPAENRPFFSFFQTDNLHAHQFPGLGSLLWKTPEFAMLQTSFWDQDRLYGNVWLGGPYSGGSWCTRDGAWMFMHMALAWKVASSTSDRLYSREDVLAFAQTDMEYFHDHFYASTPGFANPSSTMGDNYYNKLFYVADRFGCAFNDADTNFNGFHALYHLAALAYANRMGFIDALRATSTKCATVIDWIISRYRKSVVGLLTETTSPFVFGTNYSTAIWSSAMFDAAGGDLTTLPQNWAEVTAAFPPGGPDWHHSYGYGDGMDNPPTSTDPRNDDAQDFLLAGPSLLKYGLGLTGSDLDEAEAIAHGYREERRTEEQARGAGAGDVWFTYSKLSFQPLLPLE